MRRRLATSMRQTPRARENPLLGDLGVCVQRANSLYELPPIGEINVVRTMSRSFGQLVWIRAIELERTRRINHHIRLQFR